MEDDLGGNGDLSLAVIFDVVINWGLTFPSWSDHDDEINVRMAIIDVFNGCFPVPAVPVLALDAVVDWLGAAVGEILGHRVFQVRYESVIFSFGKLGVDNGPALDFLLFERSVELMRELTFDVLQSELSFVGPEHSSWCASIGVDLHRILFHADVPLIAQIFIAGALAFESLEELHGLVMLFLSIGEHVLLYVPEIHTFLAVGDASQDAALWDKVDVLAGPFYVAPEHWLSHIVDLDLVLLQEVVGVRHIFPL